MMFITGQFKAVMMKVYTRWNGMHEGKSKYAFSIKTNFKLVVCLRQGSSNYSGTSSRMITVLKEYQNKHFYMANALLAGALVPLYINTIMFLDIYKAHFRNPSKTVYISISFVIPIANRILVYTRIT